MTEGQGRQSKIESRVERAVMVFCRAIAMADNIEQLRISHVATIGIGNRGEWRQTQCAQWGKGSSISVAV